MDIQQKIFYSLNKFKLNLAGKKVLTEAASGNYIVTPIIAALAGADVVAITKDSKYATAMEVVSATYRMAEKFKIKNKIKIHLSYKEMNLQEFDILTNTGFNRPINRVLIDQLSSKCVIPLMWEPWEFRSDELDIDYCLEKGIKVYGTNESDSKLNTMKYIGYTVLYFLLQKRRSPFSSNILILGDNHFGESIAEVLEKNDYKYKRISNYTNRIEFNQFSSIIFAEHSNDQLLFGVNGFIAKDLIDKNIDLIHIAGNVDFSNVKNNTIPKMPADFGHMSFTTDYIDSMAIIELHTAGFKVAEGMLDANEKGLKGKEYKVYLENNYPALAFSNNKYW